MTPAVAGADDVALPTPLGDRFYVAPANIGDYANGDIVASRKMPNPPGFVNIETWQLKFRSTDMYERPIAAVTTLLLPQNRTANAPVLSFQDIVNALGLECAPSQTLFTQTNSLTARQGPALNGLLAQGWVIEVPDHLGPRSAYGAAQLGGRITLDGIKAGKNFRTANISKSPVGLIGYSGGGMATAWAAALAPTYAPGLRLAGSAYGGAPMNLIKMAEGLGYNNPHPAFGLAYAAAVGLSREYPDEIPMWDNLTDLGRSMYLRMQNACTNEILEIGQNHSADEMTPDVKIFDDPTVRAVVAANGLDIYPGSPNSPVFEWHSPTDELIPVDSIITTNNRYCRAGVRVSSLLTPAPNHVAAYPLGIPEAIQWLSDRFAGLPAPSTC
ncbi:UNVERIFIED_CONTAM: secretory lipase [Williamsia faeni]